MRRYPLFHEDGVVEGMMLSWAQWLLMHLVFGWKHHKWWQGVMYYSTLSYVWSKATLRQDQQTKIWAQSVALGSLISAIPQYLLEVRAARRSQ